MNQENLCRAIEIGDFIIEKAIKRGEGCVWSESLNGDFVINFYSGNTGIAYFFIQLYKSTRQSRYLRITREALVHCIDIFNSKDVISSGLYNGVYGFLIAYDDYLSEAPGDKLLDVSYLLSKVSFDFHNSPDLIHGHSGAILGLLKLLERNNFELDYSILDEHFIRLLSFLDMHKHDLVFKEKLDSPLSGLSHGQSGVASLLIQLKKYLKTDFLDELIDSILLFEMNQWKLYGRFRDLRSRHYFNENFENIDYQFLKRDKLLIKSFDSWCHGAYGIALVYSFYAKEFPNKANWNYLLSIYNFINKDFLNDNTYPLCHGVFGNELILYKVFEVLKERFDEVNKPNRSRFIWEGSIDLFSKVNEDFSFMNGLSGIGYFFLMKDANCQYNILFPFMGITTTYIPKSLKNKSIFHESILQQNKNKYVSDFLFLDRYERVHLYESSKFKVNRKIIEFKDSFNLDTACYFINLSQRNKAYLVTNAIDIQKISRTEGVYFLFCEQRKSFVYFFYEGEFICLEISKIEFNLLMRNSISIFDYYSCISEENKTLVFSLIIDLFSLGLLEISTNH